MIVTAVRFYILLLYCTVLIWYPHHTVMFIWAVVIANEIKIEVLVHTVVLHYYSTGETCEPHTHEMNDLLCFFFICVQVLNSTRIKTVF
jgi:hypothetical protein